MKPIRIPQVPEAKTSTGVVVPAHQSVVESETKPAGDFSEVNAFDRLIWQNLYTNIDNPAAAQAVLEMSETMPIVEKLYPGLLVRARQTLIAHEAVVQRQAARKVRRRMFVSFAARIARRAFLALTSALQSSKQPAQQPLL